MAESKMVPELRFAGFSDDWGQRKLGDTATSFEYGLNAAAKEYDGANKYLRITDIDDSSRIFKDDDLTSPDTDLSTAAGYRLQDGDILFARTGASVGKSFIYREADGLVYFAGFLIRAKIKSEWISERMARLPHHKLSGKKETEWELGSPAPAQYAMISEIVNYVVSLSDRTEAARRERFVDGMTKIADHERALLYYLLEGTDTHTGLRHIKGVHVFMDGPDLLKRDLIIGIGFDNIEYAAAVKEYEKRGVIVYERVVKSLYSARMLKSFGLDGCVRVSPLHCHHVADIENFLEVTKSIAAI